MLREVYTYIASGTFPLYPMWDVTNTPHANTNVLIVSYGITRSNRQIPHLGLKWTISTRLGVSRYIFDSNFMKYF